MPNLLIKEVPAEDISAFNQIKLESKSKGSLQTLQALLKKWLTPGAGPATEENNNTELLALKSDYEALENENEQLNLKVTDLENKLAEKPGPPQGIILTGNQFVYEPTADLQIKMKRVIAYFIKNGKLDRSAKDLPQQLVTKCINYTFKNEYSDIFK